MIYVKIHETETGKIVAMCDESLIDKVLQEGKVLLDIKGYSDFYKGSLITAEQFAEISTSNMTSANIVGSEAVDAAIAKKVIERGHVKTVKGIPYAHAYKVDF